LPFLDPQLDGRKAEWVRREHWPRLVTDVAAAVVRMAKDLQLTPPLLRDRLEALGKQAPLLDMGHAVYADYQRALAYRGAVDYDDLIRLALLALQSDGTYLLRLRHRWPFILEDEAQDSSRLQERSLGCWAAPLRAATGCAWEIPTRQSTRPSRLPARGTCGSSGRHPASTNVIYPTPAVPP